MAELLRHTFTKEQIELLINCIQHEITTIKKNPESEMYTLRLNEIKAYLLSAHRLSISYIKV